MSALTETSCGFRSREPRASRRRRRVRGAQPSGASADEETRRTTRSRRSCSFALGATREPDDARDRVYASDGWLYVSGPRRFHEQVPGVLAELRRALATIEVELSILPARGAREASSAVLDAAEGRPPSRDREAARDASHPLRPGSQTLLEAVARRAYVKDYDTEVAQELEGGRSAHRRDPEGHPRERPRRPDARTALRRRRSRARQAELDGPMRTQILTSTSPATLQLPRMWWTSTSASARLENRGALVIGNDAAPRSAWMVRVTRAGVAEDPGEPAVQLLPLRAVTRVGLRTRAPDVPLAESERHGRRTPKASLRTKALRASTPNG